MGGEKSKTLMRPFYISHGNSTYVKFYSENSLDQQVHDGKAEARFRIHEDIKQHTIKNNIIYTNTHILTQDKQQD